MSFDLTNKNIQDTFQNLLQKEWLQTYGAHSFVLIGRVRFMLGDT